MKSKKHLLPIALLVLMHLVVLCMMYPTVDAQKYYNGAQFLSKTGVVNGYVWYSGYRGTFSRDGILFYLIVGGFASFPGGAQLLYVLLIAGVSLILYELGRLLINRKVGFYSSVLFLLLPFVVTASVTNTRDIGQLFFVYSSLYFYVLHRRSNHRDYFWLSLLLGTAAGFVEKQGIVVFLVVLLDKTTRDVLNQQLWLRLSGYVITLLLGLKLLKTTVSNPSRLQEIYYLQEFWFGLTNIRHVRQLFVTELGGMTALVTVSLILSGFTVGMLLHLMRLQQQTPLLSLWFWTYVLLCSAYTYLFFNFGPGLVLTLRQYFPIIPILVLCLTHFLVTQTRRLRFPLSILLLGVLGVWLTTYLPSLTRANTLRYQTLDEWLTKNTSTGTVVCTRNLRPVNYFHKGLVLTTEKIHRLYPWESTLRKIRVACDYVIYANYPKDTHATRHIPDGKAGVVEAVRRTPTNFELVTILNQSRPLYRWYITKPRD